MRVGAHASVTLRGQLRQLSDQPAVGVEKITRLVALEPALEYFEVLRFGLEVGDRNLMRAEGAFDRYAIDCLGPRPPLGRSQNNHRPARPLLESVLPGIALNALNLGEDLVERRGHHAMRRHGVIALDHIRRIPVAANQRFQLLAGNAGENGRPRDFVAIQMKDRQHRAVAGRVEELVRVPAGGERSRLGLAISDNTCDKEIGIIESRAVGVSQ